MRLTTFVRVLGLCAGTLTAAGGAAAQTSPAGALRLEDALQQALEKNPDLVAARRQIDPLRTKPAQARALAPPELEAQIWQWPINSLNPLDTNMYMFTGSQSFLGRGKRTAQVTLAEADVRVAETSLALRERDVTAAVTAAYWDLVIARRTLAIHLASVDLLHQLTDVAQGRYAAGRISQQDVLKAIVETTKLHDDLNEFEQQADRARFQLNTLMHQPIDAPIGALTEPDEMTIAAPVDVIQALALSQQPELRVAEVEVERARAQQNVARLSGNADWSVGAGYMLQPHQTDAWLGSFRMTWPRAPWSRAAVDARVAETAGAITAAEAARDATESRVRLAVADAYRRVKAAETRAALLRTTLIPQSRQALDVSRAAYESDRVDFLAVLENERAFLDAQLSHERALIEWRRALNDLERAVGIALPPVMMQRISGSEGSR